MKRLVSFTKGGTSLPFFLRWCTTPSFRFKMHEPSFVSGTSFGAYIDRDT